MKYFIIDYSAVLVFYWQTTDYPVYPVGIGPWLRSGYKQTFPTTVGGLVGLNQLAVNALSELRWRYMRISYGRMRGSRYNAPTGNNVSICPGGAKGLAATKKKKKNNNYWHPKSIISSFIKKTIIKNNNKNRLVPYQAPRWESPAAAASSQPSPSCPPPGTCTSPTAC